MRALLVAGARPNFMKVAPVLAALRERGHETILVHTGQHFDARMSDAFFADLSLPNPDFHLGVGSGTHAEQVARVMLAFEPVLVSVRPDWVLVVGDVNSTLAAALVAVKLRDTIGVRIAHVEAGLRSNDWRMPEEVNRVLTDRMSDLLLTPSADALPNLLAEGIPESRVAFVGNVMIDTLMRLLPAARRRDGARVLGLEMGKYVLVTLHRPSNVDDPDTLRAVLDALEKVAGRHPIVFPVHPRTRLRMHGAGLGDERPGIHFLEPVGYLDMLAMMLNAAAVLTDSGGVQEETTALGVPCVTLREQTERPITISEGTNRLAPWPLSVQGILEALQAAIAAGRLEPGARCPAGWDGAAASRIVDALEAHAFAEPAIVSV